VFLGWSVDLHIVDERARLFPTLASNGAKDRCPSPHRAKAAFADNPHAGLFALDGNVIDRPHLRLAKRILAAVD